MFQRLTLSFLALAAFLSAGPVRAQSSKPAVSAEELAKAAQNPVQAMISVPFQLNTTFNYGLDSLEKRDTQYVLNIQPVVPFRLGADWNLITRTILPVVWQPVPFEGAPSISGIGNLQETAFLSPAKPGKVIWGAGPVVLIPTSSNHALGTSKWSAGPSVVVLTMPGHWVIGALVQNVWSFAGPQEAPSVNEFLLQYFVNYNLAKGWFLTSSPVNTADWTQAQSKDRWTVPVGLGAGRVFHIGKQAVSTSLHYYYNVVRPTGTVPSGPYEVRFQFQLMFPE